MGKNLLFIAPCFHNYENFIIEELKRKGFNVYFSPERDYSFIFNIVNHISKHLLDIKQSKHYNNILNKVKGIEFDYLFVIRGYKMTNEFIKKFKHYNPNAKLIMYQWDSNITNPFSHIVSLFDKVYSFDFRDCKDLSINYLPLFYTDDVMKFIKSKEYESDFFFMGTYLPERYNALVKFKDYTSAKDYNLKYFIYIKFTSLIKELLKGKRIHLPLLSTKHMDRNTYLLYLSSTKIMVDVSNCGQTGLAMRIIEALSMNKKIITSNKYIMEEPFYNPNNILVYDVNEPNIPDDFVDTDFKGNVRTLSLSNWLDVLIS